jgi:polyferredoxin
MNKTKFKISIPQAIRRFIQLASFILLPGLFVSIFSAMKDIFTALIGGTFSFGALSGQLWLLLAVIPVTVLAGRFFCGYFCAFGAMGDVLWFMSNKIGKKKIRVGERADRILKKLKYVLLFLIAALGWTGLVSFDAAASPWTIFGMYVTLSGWPSAAYLLSAGAALLLLIMLGSLFIERFFCRYLCPLGAVFSILSLPRLFRIKKSSSTCVACTLCTKECAMGIPIYRSNRVTSGECINCFQCVDACPRRALKADPAPALAATMATAAITGLYLIGTLAADTTASALGTTSIVEQGTAETLTDTEYTDTTSADSVTYADGVYTGTGSGYRGDTTVSVTVSGGAITDITVVSYRDDDKYFSRAVSTVISGIISRQSLDVSTVSGATFSSNGLLEAVANALSIDFTNPNSTLPKHH